VGTAPPPATHPTDEHSTPHSPAATSSRAPTHVTSQVRTTPTAPSVAKQGPATFLR